MENIIPYETLKELVIKKLYDANVHHDEAEIVADVLIHANLRGVDSHGVLRVEHYMKRIKEAGLNIRSNPKLEKTSNSTAVYHGDHGFGHVISKKSMDYAIQMAKDNGVGVVVAKNSSHCGALSYFVKQAIDQRLIGIAMTHIEACVVPFGAAEPYFGTNPMAFGFPAKTEIPVILDFATSNVAFGKVLNAKEYGKQIPSDWGIDEDGNPTTDPGKVAYLSPFGGAKGYGLAMVVEIFSGLLSGSAFGPQIPKMFADYKKMLDIGHFFMAIDPAKFTMAETFLDNMDLMIRQIHSLVPAKGFTKVLVPGEIEAMQEEKRKNEGIPLPNSVWEYLNSNTLIK
ncbi:ureidoglycolate dehydrogenase [Neobacillus niacini]|uniref:ureidoglycolate dehydrogenase n=1 Tax=Neobacillus niacini TaxID=86668 RepID=UPI0005ED5477|nr:ureidoglycolate dehydrogenase [Neobacillus niacini]